MGGSRDSKVVEARNGRGKFFWAKNLMGMCHAAVHYRAMRQQNGC